MSLFRRRLFLVVALSLALIAISMTAGRTSRAAFTPPAADSDPYGLFVDSPQKAVSSGFDVSNLDRSANACQDFNRFANGGWTARNAIPAAYSVWGRFTQLDEQNMNVLHGILEGLAKKKTLAAGNEQKIADFFGSCMDEAKIES